MERKIIGTVVGVEAKDANTCFVEIECEAVEDATAFQIISTDLVNRKIEAVCSGQ
jgi:hypothetical protein